MNWAIRLFPDYHLSVRCRKANERRWDEDDVLETLCDIAASEFMFPLPWFQESLDRLDWTAEGILKLADLYQASPEATVRRIVERTVGPVAAVFFSWKHKPSEAAQIRRNRRQPALVC